jgi:chromosome partitioning protein
MGFAENLGVIINMKDAQSSVEADYQRWLNENPDNRLFAQTVPRTSALQHASHLSPVERSYMAKYPGESSVAVRAVCQELLNRLDAANATAESASPPVAPSAPPIGSEAT